MGRFQVMMAVMMAVMMMAPVIKWWFPVIKEAEGSR